MSTSSYSFGSSVQIPYSDSVDRVVERSAAWTHPGTGNTIRGMAVSFVTYNGGYRLDSIKQGGSTLVSGIRNTIGAGETVTIPLPETAWSGLGGGTVTARFMRPYERQGYYTDIVLTVTWETDAEESTAVVAETEAGQPQTVAITNASDTVQHRVTWSYEGGLVTSGEILYGAATRFPAWAVPAANLPTLYAAVTDRGYIEGTVTVETLTADGASLGSTDWPARLRIPDSAGPTLTVSTQAVHDEVAQAVMQAHQDIQWLQHHSKVVITPTAAGQYGAGIQQMIYRTPTGGAGYATQDPVTVELGLAGSYAIRVVARDTRGLTRTVEVPVAVTACEAPRITGADAQRWSSGTAAGHQDDEGSWAQVYAQAETTALSTGETWTYSLSVSGAQVPTATGIMTPDQHGIAYVGGGLMDPEAAYTLTVTVTDSLGQSTSARLELPTGLYTLHFLKGGKGMAIGKQAERRGLEIGEDWPITIHGQRLEEYMLDRLYPVGSMVTTADTSWDPMAQWPWTEWGRLSDVSVDGITMARWVRGR